VDAMIACVASCRFMEAIQSGALGHEDLEIAAFNGSYMGAASRWRQRSKMSSLT
jgi:hypothetical protein